MLSLCKAAAWKTDLWKQPPVSGGPGALLTGDHIDLCSADTSRCDDGFLGHKFNAYPVGTQASHFGAKAKRRIRFRMNLFHLHEAKIIDLQRNRPELKIPVQHIAGELELHGPVQLNEHEKVEAGEFYDDSLTNVLRQRHWWSVWFHSPSNQQLILDLYPWKLKVSSWLQRGPNYYYTPWDLPHPDKNNHRNNRLKSFITDTSITFTAGFIFT